MSYKIIIEDQKFSAAHFIAGHDKCGRIHGHNFLLSVEIGADTLDENYFVIDFIDVKKLINDETDKLDHHVLVPSQSDTIQVEDADPNYTVTFTGKTYSIPKIDVVLLPLPAVTSELLAKYFYDALKAKYEVNKIRVRVGESSSSFAEFGD
jgi:6-pyruvoyltetrahydropterin/6-carboxytetrahydropterin synthase